MVSAIVYTSDAAHSEARARREAARRAAEGLVIDQLAVCLGRDSAEWGVKLQGWRTTMTARGLAETLTREPDEVRDWWPIQSA